LLNQPTTAVKHKTAGNYRSGRPKNISSKAYDLLLVTYEGPKMFCKCFCDLCYM